MTCAERYLKLLHTIRQTALDCGRDPKDIQLVAVSKEQPLSLILEVYEAGCRDFGENRIQEALMKAPALPFDLRLHMIGTLQRNKVRHSLGKFALIHSADSLQLVNKISEESVLQGLVTDILLQVNVSGEASKHGLSPEDWQRGLEYVFELPSISVRGLMTIAPFVDDEKIIRTCFQSLYNLRESWRKMLAKPGSLPHLSMGMTADYKIAIQEGATILRIGRAIFQ